MSWADENDITCWDPEEFELYYDFLEWRKQEKEEALSLIDDIKEEDFIVKKKINYVTSDEVFLNNLSTWMTRDEAVCTMYNNLMQKLEHIENLLKNK